MGQEILHCATKKGEKWKPSKRYYDDLAINKRIVKAKKGDVLINRIGKDAGYWYVNDIDNIAISDCLLLLRNTTKKMLNVLKRNSDNNGRLKITERGVSVPYITADDIQLLFHNEKDIINAR